MSHLSGKARNQVEMLCLEELVSANSPARQIDWLVDNSDTSYFLKSEAKNTGRPPYHPKAMLKLYIYGMENSVTSSRKLDRECNVSIEAMWLLNGLKPDDRTICNFRSDNAQNITRFFNEVTKSLKSADLIDGKIVAVDGTKIRANNSKRNNYSLTKLKRLIDGIDKKIAEYMTELDKNDELEELKERKTKYEGFKEDIKSGKVSEVSTTDPDARLMKQGNNGTDVSYNVQVAVDSKNKLIAGVLVINEANDQGQLSKVALSVKDNLGLNTMLTPADKGYYDTDDIKTCKDNNITTIVATPKEREPEEGIEFKKSDFQYNEEKDCYRCPNGETLRFSTEDDDGTRRYENRKACKNCPKKEQCTKGVRRVITRHEYAKYAEENDKRYKEDYEIYKLRQLLCEHPFGTAKRTMGIRQFKTTGLTKVSAETALIFLCYNLKRLRRILPDSGGKLPPLAQFSTTLVVFSIFFYFFGENNNNFLFFLENNNNFLFFLENNNISHNCTFNLA